MGDMGEFLSAVPSGPSQDTPSQGRKKRQKLGQSTTTSEQQEQEPEVTREIATFAYHCCEASPAMLATLRQLLPSLRNDSCSVSAAFKSFAKLAEKGALPLLLPSLAAVPSSRAGACGLLGDGLRLHAKATSLDEGRGVFLHVHGRLRYAARPKAPAQRSRLRRQSRYATSCGDWSDMRLL